MNTKGTIVEWNDDRGFGFIEPYGGGARVFCHIKAFSVRVRRPQAGDAVTYRATKDTKGRLQASDVRPLGLERAAYNANGGRSRKQARKPSSDASRKSNAASYLFIAVFAASLAVLVAANRISMFVPLIYIAMTGITLFAYAFDKSAAIDQRWRTQESTLHVLALAGGWPGGLIAQRAFRHKSSKTSFLVTFWVCVILNVLALAAHSGLLPSLL